MWYALALIVILVVAVILNRVLSLEQASYWIAAIGVLVTILVAAVDRSKTGIRIKAGRNIRKTKARSDGGMDVHAGQDIEESTFDNK